MSMKTARSCLPLASSIRQWLYPERSHPSREERVAAGEGRRPSCGAWVLILGLGLGLGQTPGVPEAGLPVGPRCMKTGVADVMMAMALMIMGLGLGVPGSSRMERPVGVREID